MSCSSGHVNSDLTTVSKIVCQKSENLTVKNWETFQKTSYSKKQSSKSYSGHVDCSFDNLLLKFPLKVREIKLKVQKWQKFFWKNLLSLKLFYWLRKHKIGNRAKKYLPEVRESYREKLRNISNDILLQQTGFKRLLWTRRLQFWQPFFWNFHWKSVKFNSKYDSDKKLFWKNLLSLKMFYCLRKHKIGNRAKNYLPEVRES